MPILEVIRHSVISSFISKVLRHLIKKVNNLASTTSGENHLILIRVTGDNGGDVGKNLQMYLKINFLSLNTFFRGKISLANHSLADEFISNVFSFYMSTYSLTECYFMK